MASFYTKFLTESIDGAPGINIMIASSKPASENRVSFSLSSPISVLLLTWMVDTIARCPFSFLYFFKSIDDFIGSSIMS